MTSISQRFTGRHMAVILVGFFVVVIVVNIMMARLAMSTFGGVVVENSYVASQEFNRWMDEAAKEKALGWSAAVIRLSDDKVQVRLTGAPELEVTVTGVARHPLGRLPDQTLRFARGTDGSFVSAAALPKGRWRLRLSATIVDKVWRSEVQVP